MFFLMALSQRGNGIALILLRWILRAKISNELQPLPLGEDRVEGDYIIAPHPNLLPEGEGAENVFVFSFPSSLVSRTCIYFDTFNPLGLDFKH